MQPVTGGARGSCQKRASEIFSLNALSRANSSGVECRASISGLSLTFCDGKLVLRMSTRICCDWPLSPRESAKVEDPGGSFTETGSNPNRVPSGCAKRVVVRPLRAADVKSAGQVMRKVSPRFTCFGLTEHCCPRAGQATTAEQTTKKELPCRKFFGSALRTAIFGSAGCDLVLSRPGRGLASAETIDLPVGTRGVESPATGSDRTPGRQTNWGVLQLRATICGLRLQWPRP